MHSIQRPENKDCLNKKILKHLPLVMDTIMATSIIIRVHVQYIQQRCATMFK